MRSIVDDAEHQAHTCKRQTAGNCAQRERARAHQLLQRRQRIVLVVHRVLQQLHAHGGVKRSASLVAAQPELKLQLRARHVHAQHAACSVGGRRRRRRGAQRSRKRAAAARVAPKQRVRGGGGGGIFARPALAVGSERALVLRVLEGG
jgi:hypothetical protein